MPTRPASDSARRCKSCTCLDPANYNDRIGLPVMEPTTISTCFGECSTDGWTACAPPPTVFYDVTFNVNMANEDVSSDGVFLAGGAHFGWPGDNPMSDDDGDGIWSITVNLAEGTAGNYTFLNGNCGDWSCKERALTPDKTSNVLASAISLGDPQRQLQRPHSRTRAPGTPS